MPRLEAVPDDGDEAREPPRVRARGVSAVATSVSALVVVVLLALLVVAVILVVRQL